MTIKIRRKSSDRTDSYESESPANEKNYHVWAIPENDERGRTGAAVSHPNSAAKGFADQLETRTQPRRDGDPLQPESQATKFGYATLGADPLLGKRSEGRLQEQSMPELKRSKPRRLTAKRSRSADA